MKDKHRLPWLSVIVGGESLVSHTVGSLLVHTVHGAGLSRELSRRLGPWRRPLAIHDPGKIVLDLAVAVALGGDCAADVAVLRAQPGVFGLVASDPTVSRLVTTLAGDVDAALGAIAAARERVWGRAGAPVQDGRVVIDLNATLVTAHSEKESATRTWKRPLGPARCWPVPITATGAPGSRWPGCCARATPAPTPPPTTSRCSTPRWRSCPRYEPKRLRLRILAVAGRLTRTARRQLLKIDQPGPGPTRSPPPTLA